MAGAVNPRLKRALWCRWFHRWRWPSGGKPSSVTSAIGGQALVLTAGPGRTCCDACRDTEPMTRAYRQWLAS
jgi:hypothetical protein